MIFFMLTGALRSAGDARTPMVLGIAMTVLNLLLNIVLIRGLGPISVVRDAWLGDGHVHQRRTRGDLRAVEAVGRRLGRGVPRGRGLGPDWTIIRSCFASACRRESRVSR